MSYDYNALVSEISKHRKHAAEESGDVSSHLQHSVDTFATLSAACPMTPLLWMKYAFDASKLIQVLLNNTKEALDMRLQTLQLGLGEFPSCAPLWLHYLQILVSHKDQDRDVVKSVFEEALKKVGQGSHRNEGEVVASIYRLFANFLASQSEVDHDAIMDLFVQRSQTPIREANDAIMDEFQQFCALHNIQDTNDAIQRIEQGRMWVARTYSSLNTWHDEVDMAMNEEGILSRHQIGFALDNPVAWDEFIQTEHDSRFWMGLGGAKTSFAFVKLARACTKYSFKGEDDDEDSAAKDATEKHIHGLALDVYERGISECPTVESLWLKYLRHLTYLSNSDSSVSKIQNVANRAVRNCPYSLPLYQQKIEVLGLLANVGHTVLDPDAVMAVVQVAIDSKFLQSPESFFDLHMTAIRVVKRRIMSIISKATAVTTKQKNDRDSKLLSFDDSQAMEKAGTLLGLDNAEIDEETEQEIQDLAEDLREMYDKADSYLRKNHNSWNLGRTLLWKERAMTESYLLGPILTCLAQEDRGSNAQVGNESQEMIRCFEKLIRLHQPTHPDFYAEYISSVLVHHDVSTPGAVLTRLRKVRGLYQKAIMSAKKHPTTTEENGSTTVVYRDVETALRSLGHEYLDFELCFGSEESYDKACKSVHKKMIAASAQNGGDKLSAGVEIANGDGLQDEAANESNEMDGKRKPAQESADQPSTKKQKPLGDEDAVPHDSPAQSKKANLKVVKPPPEHTVRVGKLDFPAHPFTVKVSNLSLETEDMDLVDYFKPRCGPVLHARILREKKHGLRVGRSRGIALIQFEERSGVEKAISLSDEVGLHDKVIKVERSHVRAVDVVPPGMYRKNPYKGKKHKKGKSEPGDHVKPDGTDTVKPKSGENLKTTTDAKNAKPDFGVLAFRPRGVAHAPSHRKMHIGVSKGANKLDKDKGNTK